MGVWDIAPMDQWGLAHLCLSIGQRKSVRRNGRIARMCLRKFEKQGIKESLGYCANGPMGVRSHMSKPRTKEGSEEKWRDCSNVSNTIVKQGIEGSLVSCANGPMGLILPMSKTRSKKGSEEKWQDCSIVSKTI